MPVQVRPAVPEAASGDNRPFWAIFYAKKTARRKALPRLYSLPGELFPFCGLYSPFSPPFSPALSKNASPEQNPPSAPMSAAGMGFTESVSAISTPTTAPIKAGVMTIVITATTMTNRDPIRMIKSLPKRNASLATKGYFRPLTSHG